MAPWRTSFARRTTRPPSCVSAHREPAYERQGRWGSPRHWDFLRHDSGYSSVLWISEWPRQDVAPNFLHPVIFAQGVRRSLTLIAHPLEAGEALREIRREKTEAITDSTQKARVGRIDDLSDRQEYEDVLARERALIAGHADMEFSGFVSVTAPSRDELTTAVSQVEQAFGQTTCETRVLFGRQAQAFVVAALPFAALGQLSGLHITQPVYMG